MNRRTMISRTSLAMLGLETMGWPLTQAADSDTRPAKILFFSKSSGFEHSVIKKEGDTPSHAEGVLIELGKKHHFDFTFSKDGSRFNPDYLAQFDAYFFYTTGDLTKAGTDKHPPMTAEGKTALLEAIKNGKGFIGTHSASDTFHSPGPANKNNEGNMDDYIAMLGGEFIIHGAQQKSKMICADASFPEMEEVKDGFTLHEEWYALKNFAPDLHVLLVQETAGMQGPMYQRAPYPCTWARPYGQGRVFYTSMGHREDVWTNPLFQRVLLGGLEWATRRVNADIAPNLDAAAPHGKELPESK